jgi:hypothetical protein
MVWLKHMAEEIHNEMENKENIRRNRENGDRFSGGSLDTYIHH